MTHIWDWMDLTYSTAKHGAFWLLFFCRFFTIPVLGSLIVQFPRELVELVDDGHLGVEDLVEAVSHEVGILVGSVTTVDEILEGVDDQVVHGDAFVLGNVLDPSFHTAGDGDVEFLFGGC